MSEQILSSEEVDAILKVTHDKDKNQRQDLSTVVGEGNNSKEQTKHYTYALNNMNEVFRGDCEKQLASFLRKKILVTTKSFNLTKVSTLFGESTDKVVYSIFRLAPSIQYGMVMVDMGFLHQTINLLFGGKISRDDKIMEIPGKVGSIIVEKIAQLFLGSFAVCCKEFGVVNSEIIKTTTSKSLASNIGLEQDSSVYLLEMTVFFDDIETAIKFIVSEEFLMQFIPIKRDPARHKEKDFWRTAIKSQVVDSIVTVNITLPDVSMKVREFMALTEGDLITISEPTMVYVCLNNLKLFRASAGQANSKRVAKIINQI